ncbi:MAG: SRPBCC family protein [Acidimicrobiales bacterium]
MHDIVHELTIDASPEEVYAAVSTGPGLASWWSSDVALEIDGSPRDDSGPVEGDVLSVGFDDRAVVIRLRIDTLNGPGDEGPALAHLTCLGGPEEWPGTQLAFRIEAEPDRGTTLRFWHGGWEYEDGALPRASFQWAMYLDALRRSLEREVERSLEG